MPFSWGFRIDELVGIPISQSVYANFHGDFTLTNGLEFQFLSLSMHFSWGFRIDELVGIPISQSVYAIFPWGFRIDECVGIPMSQSVYFNFHGDLTLTNWFGIQC
ncbi:hypothetical protein AVEN_135639-1 [Araneus ventricosus]|uniref:Uncharacterized protein n=1 Tax=Araneus ventricosus TaxID=182803 RepID=A0A4Y2WAE0_ARAVE|nr:hypothetical protein AVEN_135639-1 [Araneus ventricosus]